MRYKLNRMVQYTRAHLDASFAALSDATRRGVLEQLGRGDASITDLAEKFDMTLTGMKKHVGVLETARLVTTEKVGRVRTCRLGPRRLEDVTAWIERTTKRKLARVGCGGPADDPAIAEAEEDDHGSGGCDAAGRRAGSSLLVGLAVLGVVGRRRTRARSRRV